MRVNGTLVVAERHDYAQFDRAVTAGEPRLREARRGPAGPARGATVAAPPHGGEAIAGLAARVEAGGKTAEVSQTVHASPTFAEGPARAADEHLRARYLTDRTRRVARPVLALLRALERRR